MNRARLRDLPAALALWATGISIAAWVLLGMRLEGWQPLAHPFALAGARGLPDAALFNALVFVLPGALMALLADRLRRRLPDTVFWRQRIGCALALLAALGWGAQGLLPLDLGDLDAAPSRWHALAWALWWLAAAGAAGMLAGPGLRLCAILLVAVLLVPAALPAGSALTVLAQPLAALIWGGWMWAALRQPSA